HADHPRRSSAARAASARAEPPRRSSDDRSGGILGAHLSDRTKRAHAPLSAARVADRSPHGDAARSARSPAPPMSHPPKKPWGGVWTLWPALLGVVAHFVLRDMLNPWLNASSDVRFWGAI